MMVDLKVMAYFKLSLSTHNWYSAFFIAPFDLYQHPERAGQENGGHEKSSCQPSPGLTRRSQQKGE
ncbi:hypothetical protein, partial [Aeromonas allosaccharophila]|uniref:hypothetical protein n=1 Tax=Aeromonas allosaccharophila TaxID=656 RepID=UPI003003F13A